MSKKKTTKKTATPDSCTNIPATDEVVVESTQAMSDELPSLNIIDPIEEPVIVEDSPKVKALKEFASIWNGMKQHNYMTDAQAREVHKLWQTVTGRTDYYTNCGVCTINHIKSLKKLCKNEGIEVNK